MTLIENESFGRRWHITNQNHNPNFILKGVCFTKTAQTKTYENKIWFQQIGAPSHSGQNVRN